tara:strand:+ start:84 stop:650 length:567 start_codon:yes stop_codon:yes gene_type:complete
MIFQVKNIAVVIKIVLPAVICFLFNYYGNGYDNIYIVIIPFSLVIALSGISKLKYNFAITLFATTVLSYIILYASIFTYLGLGRSLEFLLNLMNSADEYTMLIFRFIFIFSLSIFPLILIFYIHQRLFEIPKTKLTNYIKTIAFLSLSCLMLLNPNNGSILIGIWQFITLLALQSILYQNEIIGILEN